MKCCRFMLFWASPVVLVALGWATLPRSRGALEDLNSHARLFLHLVGLLPRLRDGKYGQRTVAAPRQSNGSIEEVQGFVDAETFRAKYLWKAPVVFRGAATKDFGFDIDCLTRGGRSAKQGLVEETGDRKIRVFRDQYDDASATYMTLAEYERISDEATSNRSKAVPYPRAFPQNSMRSCELVPTEKMKQYRSWFGWLFQQYMPEPDVSVVFASFTEGTNTKMHIDVGDSFFTQVYGRKKWLLVDPEYLSHMQVYGDRLNLVYISGFDAHREPLPPEVPVKEVILNPGDVLYFPVMTFHAVYNLDPVTIGVDNVAGDIAGGLVRHWLLTATTALNPWIIVKALSILWRTGSFCGTDLYFDGFSKNSETKTSRGD